MIHIGVDGGTSHTSLRHRLYPPPCLIYHGSNDLRLCRAWVIVLFPGGGDTLEPMVVWLRLKRGVSKRDSGISQYHNIISWHISRGYVPYATWETANDTRHDARLRGIHGSKSFLRVYYTAPDSLKCPPSPEIYVQKLLRLTYPWLRST